MAKRTVFVWIGLLGSIAGGWVRASQTAAPPQTPSKPAVFEVAAIKPTDMATISTCYLKGQPGGQTFVGRCIPVRLLMKYAYKIVDSQIASAPGWMDRDLYDLEAKSDRPVTRAEIGSLFQGLLAERFHLKFHLETRTMPALILTMDKSGNKMKANDSEFEWDIPVTRIPGIIPTIKGTRCPMSYLSWWIGQQESRPVLDKTGLGGFWDFTLEYVPDALGAGRRGGDGATDIERPAGPSLATALREQLGLKLETDKGPVDVYVIDRVEKAEN